MLDTTIKRYTTQRAASVLLAVLAVSAIVLAGRLYARPGDVAEATKGGQVHGHARVVDGDTLVVAGARVRLEGIDAPEAAQTCNKPDGSTWSCGTAAAQALQTLIGGREVRCDDVGTDKYGRMLGLCRVGTLELNREMVRLGLAWAFVRYSQRYVDEEAGARLARRGVWQANSQPAWDYRAGQWRTAETSAPGGCAIKGNVSAKGRIYHMPWNPWYDKVRMDGTLGKRWFCTETEATAAGWRPAVVH